MHHCTNTGDGTKGRTAQKRETPRNVVAYAVQSALTEIRQTLCQDDPEKLRERFKQKISLSAMTYSHELARVMLAEQIYRAFAILSGSPYPR